MGFRGNLSGLKGGKEGLKMPGPLLKSTDLNSLLTFEKLCDDWVREVHKFNSERKKKKNYVIFRNCENKKLTSLEELKNELEDTSFLENTTFKTGFDHDIVSNKVGANKVARRAAKAWMAESAGEKVSTPVVKKAPIVKETPVKKEIPKKIERVSSNPPVAEPPVEKVPEVAKSAVE